LLRKELLKSSLRVPFIAPLILQTNDYQDVRYMYTLNF